MDAIGFIKRNKELLVNYSKEFNEIFGIGLRDFMNPIYGFDIIKFDTWLKTDKNISVMEQVKNKYSEKGRDLIKKLIGAV